MYKCCIFDLDGTIINTIDSLTHTFSLTLEHFGYPPLDEAHTRKFVGDGFKKGMERALLYRGDKSLSHYEEAVTFFQEIFQKTCLYKVKPYDGLPEFFAFLKEKGIKIAVLTNKAHDQAVTCVEAVYGKGFFDSILGEGNGVKCKPDPAGAFLTAKKLHSKPYQCLYFGDTNTDMRTGIQAGMDTVAVTWGFRDREELVSFHPKYVIDHPDEIMKIFE